VKSTKEELVTLLRNIGGSQKENLSTYIHFRVGGGGFRVYIFGCRSYTIMKIMGLTMIMQSPC